MGKVSAIQKKEDKTMSRADVLKQLLLLTGGLQATRNMRKNLERQEAEQEARIEELKAFVEKHKTDNGR